jgi:serine O-acetyltransferase
MLATLRRDIQSVFDRDPAARSLAEVLLCYPGLHAVWGYRLAHWLWFKGLKLAGRWVSQMTRAVTGIEIHPGATIGPGLFIDHGMGVVIGETAELGANVTLYHGVTLGGTSWQKGKRHPTLGDNVVVGAGAKILGAFTIGENSRVGANAVVVKPVPANAVVVGVPGEVVARHKPRVNGRPDLEHAVMPDVLGDTVLSLMKRLELLEHQVHTHPLRHIQAPTDGVWHGEDFTI